MLNATQCRTFREDGFLVVENAFSTTERKRMLSELDRWTELSCAHDDAFGQLTDGRPRFDVEADHNGDNPKLRRVTNPIDISDVYADIVFNGCVPDLISALLGPHITFDHCKLNQKMPGMETTVSWHQDHAFEPQTNDDMITALFALDDMHPENGGLSVAPGSHHQKFSHYQNGVFTGQVCEETMKGCLASAETLSVPAGSVVLMDTWTLHGSARNTSDMPRRLFITEYKAADAFPLTPHKLPSVHTGRVVRGRRAMAPRHRNGIVELPPVYNDASLFGVQQRAAAA